MLDGTFANALPRPAGSPEENNLSGMQLFNLAEDLAQQIDRSAQEPARVGELRAILAEHRAVATRPGAQLVTAPRYNP